MDALVELFRRIADIERRMANVVRHGTVAEVDPKGRVRLKIGENKDGSPFLSPWVPYSQVAGALKVHSPPSVGQQMTLIAPTGDTKQAVALPMTWSNQNTAPSEQGNEHVLTFGQVRLDMTGGKLKITAPEIELVAGGHSQKLTGSGSTFTGGRVEHDGNNIGKDHKHRDVVPGGALTGIPTQ